MDKKLAEILRAAGKETASLRATDGPELLVLPFGGRVLGLYAPNDSHNFLWTNPVLESVETARAFYASEAWKNSGGDRTWLAPESDFFAPNHPANDVYYQPRALDPGTYQMEEKVDEIRLSIDLTLTSYRHRRPVALRLAKSVQMAENPLRPERNFDGLQFAGYELHTSLEFFDASNDAPPVGVWSLLQLPHGGEVLAPLYGNAQPTTYFGEIPSGDLDVKAGALRYRTRAPGAQKIGLSAITSPGRLGYHYQKNGMSHLVIRNFSVNPSGDYIDTPWHAKDRVGDAVQICNIDQPHLGAFTELEYHVPAIDGRRGRWKAEDTSQVWAFRGTLTQISQVSEMLLGFAL